MNKKILGILVCILFFAASVVSGINVQIKDSRNSSRSNTLYVGGSEPGNYSKIQDAIDNASSDDTIFVYNGTYYENIVVDKTIDLIGEDRDTTIIDGGGSDDVIYISADWVNISEWLFPLNHRIIN